MSLTTSHLLLLLYIHTLFLLRFCVQYNNNNNNVYTCEIRYRYVYGDTNVKAENYHIINLQQSVTIVWEKRAFFSFSFTFSSIFQCFFLVHVYITLIIFTERSVENVVKHFLGQVIWFISYPVTSLSNVPCKCVPSFFFLKKNFFFYLFSSRVLRYYFHFVIWL